MSCKVVKDREITFSGYCIVILHIAAVVSKHSRQGQKTLRNYSIHNFSTASIDLDSGDVRGLKLPNTIDFFANYRWPGENVHKITNFPLRNVSEIPNTEQSLLKLPYHRQKNCQIQNAIISHAFPWYGCFLLGTLITE